MNAMSFEDLLSSVSAELRESVIAEGTAMNYERIAAAKMATLLRDRGRKRLENIATLFDYDVRHERYGYLLRKKYTDATDLPCVTFDELHTFFKSLYALTRTFSPPFGVRGDAPPTMRVDRDFLRSLNKSELARMKSSEGLLVSQLRPSPTSLLQRIFGESYIGSHYTYLDELLPILDAVQHSVLEMRQGNLLIRYATAFNRSIVANLEKSGNDSFQEYKNEMLLETVEDKWNSRAKTAKCVYAPPLREKPIVASRSSTLLTGSNIGTLVRRLYDLRIYSEGNNYEVRPQQLPRTLSNLKQFREVLIACIPSPLQRSLLNVAPLTPELIEQKAKEQMTQARAGKRTPFPALGKPWRDDAVCDAARMYLVNSLSNRSKKKDKESVPFDKATPREKSAIAIYLSQKYFEWLSSSLYKEPYHITQFPNLKLTCQQYIGAKGRPMINLNVLRLDEETQKWRTTIAWGEIWDVQ